MSGALVGAVALATFGTFMLAAQIAHARNPARRGATVARATGFAQVSSYLIPLPYVVLVLRPRPELPFDDAVRWAGLVLIVAGVAFALWAMATLGRHYDLTLEVHGGHEVVDRGPYGIVRHPIYTGLGLHFIGCCLATGNIPFIAGILLVGFPAFYIRARAEERLLRDALGPAYGAYARRVPMLVPFLGRSRQA